MSHAHAAGHAHGDGHTFHSHHGEIDLSLANTATPAGWGKGPAIGLIALGALCLGATAAYGLMASGEHAHEQARHAWLSYHVGVISTIGIMLGCLGLVLMTRAVQAGWNVTIRRQMENVASLLPLSLVLIAPLAVGGHFIWHWMDHSPEVAGDYILQKKAGYLNPTFFWIRIAVYVSVWSALGWRMYTLSRRQDVTGDKGLTNTAQRDSAWGLLLFALTSAFAAFDLSMSLDYHWFSTMFGVYFFAGNTLAGVSMTILVLIALRRAGLMKGLVTSEHFHDLGKLLNAFTIFWAYIGFSQYFLIWYANIPEETAWVLARTNGGWEHVGKLLMFGHFLLPFVLLLFRASKKTMGVIAFFAAWQLVMHFADVFWQIRPVLYVGHAGVDPVVSTKLTFAWVDVTGLFGPLLLMLGLLVMRISSGPLIPTKDPRLAEALNHKNYV